MCDTAVDTCPFVFDSVANQYKTEEMCNKVVSKEPFMLKRCSDPRNERESYWFVSASIKVCSCLVCYE